MLFTVLSTLSAQRLGRPVNHEIYLVDVLAFLTCFYINESLGHVFHVYEHLCTDTQTTQTRSLCLSFNGR